MWSSNKSVSLACQKAFSFDNFGSDQINELHIPIHSHHEILRFKVPVNNSLAKKIFQN
jgi:hypothetical protein